MEQELLLEDAFNSKVSKKKQRQRARKLQNGGCGDGMESQERENAEAVSQLNGVAEIVSGNSEFDSVESEELSKFSLDPIQEFSGPIPNGIDEETAQFSTSPPFTKQFSTEDSEGTDDHDVGINTNKIPSRSKTKKRKKNKKHQARNKFTSVSEASSDEKVGHCM